MTVVLVDARYYGDIMRQAGGGVVLCTTGVGKSRVTSNE